ncbi:MAG: hypothetical protein RLZZ546_1986 [Bacteroidota bacterium]|jgi:hypothetical protein
MEDTLGDVVPMTMFCFGETQMGINKARKKVCKNLDVFIIKILCQDRV